VRLRVKIWLEEAEGKAFGDGASDLLGRVRRTGSLRQAASEIGMSYAQAWRLVRGLEARLGFTLLQSRVGGRVGGGSALTEPAERLLGAYEVFRRECQDTVVSLYRRHLAAIIPISEIAEPGRRQGRPSPEGSEPAESSDR